MFHGKRSESILGSTFNFWCRRPLFACVLLFACETHAPPQDHHAPPASALPGDPKTPRPASKVSANSDDSLVLAEADSEACNRLSFFDFYRNARLITLDEPNNVRLQIHINYHTGAGCMAPDGYGTDLIITLRLRAVASGCFVEHAEVRAADWGLHLVKGPDAPSDRKLRFNFSPFQVLKHTNLYDPDVAAIPIHNSQYAVSALIRRTGVLWYEGTQQDSVLHTSVDSQGEEAGCCWPATSTIYRDHGVYD